MSGVSIWQPIVIALAVAIPFIAHWLVRRGPDNDLNRPRRFLNWSFAIGNVAVVALILVLASARWPVLTPGETLALALALPAEYIATWFFLASLIVLAKRLGLSSALWVGLAVLIPLLGPISAFFAIRHRVDQTLSHSGAT